MAERITQLIRAATGGDTPARGRLTRWAEEVGTTPSTVSRWRGGTVPDAEWWPALARVLNVTETEIAEVSGQSSATDVMSRLTKLEQMLSEVLDALGQTDAKFDALAAGIEANHVLVAKMVPTVRALQAGSPKSASVPPVQPSGRRRSSDPRVARSDVVRKRAPR